MLTRHQNNDDISIMAYGCVLRITMWSTPIPRHIPLLH